jgi:hypothetical protein
VKRNRDKSKLSFEENVLVQFERFFRMFEFDGDIERIDMLSSAFSARIYELYKTDEYFSKTFKN